MRAAILASVLAAASTASADGGPKGLAVGLEVGEPASATAGWFTDTLSFTGAIGSGTLAGPGLSVHADVQAIVTRLAADVPIRAGLGARFYDQHYQAMSPDELPDRRWGVRASVALAYEQPSWQLYGELAPGIDFHRSMTCNLADGAASVCPHAQSTPAFFQLVVGARFFLSH